MGRGRGAIPRIVQGKAILQRETLDNTRHLKGYQMFSQNTSFTITIGTADENLRSQTYRIDAMVPSSHFSVLQGICRRGFSSFQRSSLLCVLPTWSSTILFKLSQWAAVNRITQYHKSCILTPGAE